MLTALRVGAQFGTRAVEMAAPTFTEWVASRSLALLGKAAERTGIGESTVARWSANVESRAASVAESGTAPIDPGRRNFLTYGGAATMAAITGGPINILSKLAPAAEVAAGRSIEVVLLQVNSLVRSGLPFRTAQAIALGRDAAMQVPGIDLTMRLAQLEARIASGEFWGASTARGVSSFATQSTTQAEVGGNILKVRPLQQIMPGSAMAVEETTTATRASSVAIEPIKTIVANPKGATGVRMLTHTETPAAIDSLAKNAALRPAARAEHAEIEAQIR